MMNTTINNHKAGEEQTRKTVPTTPESKNGEKLIIFKDEESKWAWLAGLVDSEGYIGLDKVEAPTNYGYCFLPRLVIDSTSRLIIETLKRNFDAYITERKPKCLRHKTAFYYTLTPRKGLRTVLTNILNYLIVKKEQSKLMIKSIDILANNKHLRSSTHKQKYLNNCIELNEIYLKIKSLNHRGISKSISHNQDEEIVLLKKETKLINFTSNNSKWVWLAGLVDGDGCVCLGKNKVSRKSGYVFCPSLTIWNTNRALLLEVQKTFGGKIYIHYRKNPNWKTIFDYQLYQREALRYALTNLVSYLVIKRTQAKLLIEALNLLKSNRYLRTEKEKYLVNCRKLNEIYLRMKELNKRGV